MPGEYWKQNWGILEGKLERQRKPNVEKEGEGAMVKGVARKVIVVKSPDPKLFEEAIFVLREGSAMEDGVTPEQVLEQARQAARSYWKRNGKPKRRGLPAPVYMALGALAASAAWCVPLFL